MSIHLSSLCSRKKLQYIFKLIVLVVFINFVGYVVVSNFNLANSNSNSNQNENPLQSHHQHGNMHNYEKLKFEEFMKKRKEEDGKQIKIDDILGKK